MRNTDRKSFFVYKHTSPSGKVYIGITSRSPKDVGNMEVDMRIIHILLML